MLYTVACIDSAAGHDACRVMSPIRGESQSILGSINSIRFENDSLLGMQAPESDWMRQRIRSGVWDISAAESGASGDCGWRQSWHNWKAACPDQAAYKVLWNRTSL